MNLQADLWTKLQYANKPILLYGMGNGADKILAVLSDRGIEAADFFASDEFVRGHSFHGKRVLTYSQAREKYGDLIALLPFGSQLPDVLERFCRLDREIEFYVPDVPIAGEELFDLPFCQTYRAELETARSLLADDFSKALFDRIVAFRLTGSISALQSTDTPEDALWETILRPVRYESCADLGAYTGDSVRGLLKYAPNVRKIVAMEPDPRSYRKLSAYLEGAGIPDAVAIPAGAWNADTLLEFASQGNRNSSIYGGGKGAPAQMRRLDSVLAGERLDYLKIDVEGAEREALEGARETIARWKPDIRLSLYHRSRDLFALPLHLHEIAPDYRFYLRRPPYIPAWDLCLYAIQG